MSGFGNTKADTAFLKARFNKSKASGERLVGSEFWMTIKGYENLSILVITTQFPELAREDVEFFAPGGMKFNQYGPLRNSGEFQVTLTETIEGDVLKNVKEIVYGKKYLDVTLSAAAESNSGSDKGLTRTFSDCKLRSDAVDFSAEDVTTIVRPTLAIIYNWQE